MFVERSGDRWFVLSAKHGVLAPEEHVDPYDETLVGKSPTHKKQWSGRVLMELERQGTAENDVRCMAFGTGGELSGFEEHLAAAISANSGKLGETGNREKHLAIFVYDFRASRLVERTSFPMLPEEVDYVWVIHTWPLIPGKPRSLDWPSWRLLLAAGSLDCPGPPVRASRSAG